jgi:hypothetical protein
MFQSLRHRENRNKILVWLHMTGPSTILLYILGLIDLHPHYLRRKLTHTNVNIYEVIRDNRDAGMGR